MENTVKALEIMSLIYFAVGEMTIRIDKSYYVPFQSLEINCTSTIPVQYDVIELYIESEIVGSIFFRRSTGECLKAMNNTVTVCQNECRCSLNGKSVSLVHNVTANDHVLVLRCGESGGSIATTEIKKAKISENISFNSSSLLTAYEGQHVGPVSCTADCVPGCTYRWTGPGGFTTDGSILQINDINRTENGTYVCKAENLIGSLQRDIYIIVKYGPNNVSLNPPNQTYMIEEGNSLGPISSSANCNPNCTRTWTGPGISSTTNNLHIPSINRINTGQFLCTASNEVGSRLLTVKVIVQYGPNQPYLNTSLLLLLNEGQRLGPISCTSDCVPDCIYRWNGPNGFGTNGSILQINNISRTGNGTYTCTALNSYRESQNNVVIIVRYGPSIVNLNPSNATYIKEQGKPLGPISCSSPCNPNCTTTWTGPGINPTKNDLSLPSINRINTGHFTCTTSNDIGKQKTTINVTVQYSAEVTVMNITNADKDYVTENTSLHFICGAIGEPEPIIRWLFTDMSGYTKLASASSQFAILEVACKDIGTYTCEAQNVGFLPHNASKLLNVACKPRLDRTRTHQGIIAIQGSNSLNITVYIVAHPEPVFEWTFQRSNTESSNPLTDVTTEIVGGVLYRTRFQTLTPVFGKYTVTASNLFGSLVHSTLVISARGPDRVSYVTALCFADSMIVMWMPAFNGGSEQYFNVVWRNLQTNQTTRSETISDPQIGSFLYFTVQELAPNSVNIVHVVSRNRNGEVQSNQYVNCTTKADLVIFTTT